MQIDDEVPGARGFRIIFSQFVYVYEVFGYLDRPGSLLLKIGYSIQRLVGLDMWRCGLGVEWWGG